MPDRYSDGGSPLGGSFSDVGPNPFRKEQPIDKKEARQLREALSLPEREPDALDAVMDDAVERAGEHLTTLRERRHNERLERDAEIQARAMAPILNPDDYGVTQAEREEMDRYLAEEDEDEDEEGGWSVAWH
jgi:hypothetical protein